MPAAKFDLNRRYTVEEYMVLEAQAETRHEYWDGWIVPVGEASQLVDMAGGSANHSNIKTNVGGLLWANLRGKGCRLFDCDMQIKIPKTGLYVYGNFSIVCDKAEFESDDELTLLNPAVVIEVLSPSTETKDRGSKFSGYLSLPSIKEYVLVATDSPRVESYHRQSDGTWSFSYYDGLSSECVFRSIGMRLQLADIFEGIVFRPQFDPGRVPPKGEQP